MATKPNWRPPTWDDSQEKSLKKHIQDAERFRWLYPEVVSPSSPPRRIGHIAVYDRPCLHVFGGSDDNSKVADVFCVNLQKRSWTTLATTGDEPRPVEGHAAFFVEGKMFVFGGTNLTSDGLLQKSNGLSYLDVDTRVWVKSKVLGDLPPARDCHSATLVHHLAQLVVFGGKGAFPEQRHLRDVHILDLKSWTWSSPSVTGDLPRARESHGAVIVGDNLFILGGDSGDSKFVSELSVLDLTTYVWSKFEVVGRHPPPRAGHSCFAKDDRIYVFGGLGNGGVHYNDLWVLYTRFAVWTQLDVSGPVPHGRFLHSASFLAGQSAVIFYGGSGCSQGIAEILVLDVLESDQTARAAAILASREPGKLYSCSCTGCTPADVSSSKLHVEASPGGAQGSTGSDDETVLCLEAPLCNGDRYRNAAYPAHMISSLRTSRTGIISETMHIEISSGCRTRGPAVAHASAKRQRVVDDRSHQIQRIFAIDDGDEANVQSRITGDIMEAARRVLLENCAIRNLESFRQRSLLVIDNKTNIRQTNWRTGQNVSNLDPTACRHQYEALPSPSSMGPFRPTAGFRSASRTPNQSSPNTPVQSPDRAAQEQTVHIRLPMAGPVVQANLMGVVQNGYVVNAVIDGKLFAGVIGLENANIALPDRNAGLFTQQCTTERSPAPRVSPGFTGLPMSASNYGFPCPSVVPHSGATTSHRSGQRGRQLSPIPTRSSPTEIVDLTEEYGSTPGQSEQPFTQLLLSLPHVQPLARVGTLSNAVPPNCGPLSGSIHHRPTRQVTGAGAFNQAHHLQCATGSSPSVLGRSQVRDGRFRTFLPPKDREAPAGCSCTVGGATSGERLAEAGTPHSCAGGHLDLTLRLGLPGQGRHR